jgi:group I intron endonuclease
MTGVYAIKHRESGTVYVGQAVNIERRWIRHRYDLNCGNHSNSHLQRAWNKYGADAFDFNPLELCDPEYLTVREQWYLDNFLYKYNIATNAESPSMGFKHSLEHRAKLSAAMMGNKRSLGRVHSPEIRAKMSAAMTGKKHRRKIK